MYLKKDKKGRKTSKLLNSVLGCVQKVCLYDAQNFINKERFNMLMQPLLDQVGLSLPHSSFFSSMRLWSS